jgi:hypothetical protein
MKNNWLNDYASSQQGNLGHANLGEDGIIEKILDILPENDKWCVEIGAWDGVLGSNAINLIKNKDYHAVLVEGHPQKFDKLTQTWKDHPKVIGINSYVTSSGKNSLDQLLSKTLLPNKFDFLSIDIDGNDYHLWNSLNNFTPKLVVIEFNPTIPNEVEFVQEDNFELNQGSGILSMTKLAKSKGYELVCATFNNAYFVLKEYYPLFEIQDNSLAKLRTDLSRVTHIFNGYDGTVFVRGHGKIDLHNVPYLEKKFQILPVFLRGYDDGAKGKLNSFKRFLRRVFISLKKRGYI